MELRENDSPGLKPSGVSAKAIVSTWVSTPVMTPELPAGKAAEPELSHKIGKLVAVLPSITTSWISAVDDGWL